jgi:transcription elongation factor Elf1
LYEVEFVSIIDVMSKPSEYLFVCRGCGESKRIAAQDSTASLTALQCGECGDERQPIVRAVTEERHGNMAVLTMGAIQRMLVRWHVQM